MTASPGGRRSFTAQPGTRAAQGIVWPGVAPSAVVVDAVGPSSAGAATGVVTASGATETQLSWTHNVGSGEDRALYVAVAVGAADTPDTGVTVGVQFAGQALTAVGPPVHPDAATAGFTQLFRLAGPPVGEGTVLVLLSAAMNSIEGGSLSLVNVSPGTPEAAVAAAADNTGTATVAVPSTPGNLVVDAVASGSALTSSTDTIAVLRNYSTRSGAGNAGLAYRAGAATVSPSWSLTPDRWAVVAADVVFTGTTAAVPLSKTLTDAGVGTDALGVGAQVTVADTVGAADVLTAGAQTPLSDAASGADAVTVSGEVTVSDAGVGTDGVLGVSSSVPLADAATTAEALQVTFLLGDAATGADSLAVVRQVTLADTGTAADAMQSARAVALADTAAAADALTSSATTDLADTATGTDALGVAQGSNPTLPDQASGTDTLDVTVAPSLADTGTVADTLPGAEVTLPLADTAAGADTLMVGTSAPQTDAAVAADQLTVRVPVPVQDTGRAADSVAVAATVPLADAGHAADGLATTVGVPLADTIGSSDRLSVVVWEQKTLADAATVAEGFSVVVTTTLLDPVTVVEVLAVTDTLALAEWVGVDERFDVHRGDNPNLPPTPPDRTRRTAWEQRMGLVPAERRVASVPEDGRTALVPAPMRR